VILLGPVLALGTTLAVFAGTTDSALDRELPGEVMGAVFGGSQGGPREFVTTIVRGRATDIRPTGPSNAWAGYTYSARGALNHGCFHGSWLPTGTPIHVRHSTEAPARHLGFFFPESESPMPIALLASAALGVAGALVVVLRLARDRARALSALAIVFATHAGASWGAWEWARAHIRSAAMEAEQRSAPPGGAVPGK
jgi:hypothetical protein